ncbi:YebC/PmpR family DNA-binding transcriptional regulator [Candidatus Peregrinibacteria bacterium]|nr:YebC/PmpR family DNA-binding transcriptional regulator [Candidatus Peregrinibacteria bacterium]
MSGHSKWANIRIRKGAQDAKRGKIFTRHSKLIEIAARVGGSGDPDTNARLATAIENAKMDSVPNANIERAIKKGTGELKGDMMTEELYAGYGPGNSAIIIECLTDNRNRTLTNIKIILSKNGGNLAESASVMWMFARKGVVTAKGSGKKEVSPRINSGANDMELELIDFGAEDIAEDGDILTVTTDMTEWTRVRDFLKGKGYEILSAGLQYVPTQKARINDTETARKLLHIIELLEEEDDVSEVHTNADIDEVVAGKLG